MRRSLSLWLAVVVSTASPAAQALDPFEIQVYDATQNLPGELSVETHVNRVMAQRGDTAPRDAHFTLETALGATPHLELGHYLQTALLEDGTFAYAGMKLRALFTTRETGVPGLRIGINFELSLLPRRFDAGRTGGEIRPIVTWEGDRAVASLNPILGFSFGDTGQPHRYAPTLEPAAAAYAKVLGLELGAEYYAELGSAARLDGLSAQEHYAFLAGNAQLAPGIELNVGVGAGLTEVSSPWVAKLILGVSLGHLWGDARSDRAASPFRWSGARTRGSS